RGSDAARVRPPVPVAAGNTRAVSYGRFKPGEGLDARARARRHSGFCRRTQIELSLDLLRSAVAQRLWNRARAVWRVLRGDRRHLARPARRAMDARDRQGLACAAWRTRSLC